MSSSERLAQAFAAYQRGEFEQAGQFLSGLSGAQASQLRAMVARRTGQLEQAEIHLQDARALAPSDPELWRMAAAVASERGLVDEAEARLRKALAIDQRFGAAHGQLGRLLIEQKRFAEAKIHYKRQLQLQPNSATARYGMGTVLLELGDASAARDTFAGLVSAGNHQPAIRFMLGRAQAELMQLDDAKANLRSAHEADPTGMTLTELGNVLWMAGEQDEFSTLLTAASGDWALRPTAAELLRQAGEPVQALHYLKGAPQQAIAVSSAIAAQAYLDLNQPEQAEQAAMLSLQTIPGQRPVVGALISALLMQGRAEEALGYINTMRAAEPHGQHWIAYQATAFRLLGDERYQQLVDLERYVRPYRLPTPAGYQSLDAFNQSLRVVLEGLHRYQRRPLNQSLRGGTQTSIDLLAVENPVVQAYLAALKTPIREYLADIGRAEGHPLTSRNQGKFRLAGCWSVRLGGGGKHVSHVHPEGWISSAYYVQTPPELNDESRKAGWIGFEQPAFATRPPTTAARWIKPEPGMVVLFPSYVWHGTNPIDEGSTRLTAPFDVVPD